MRSNTVSVPFLLRSIVPQTASPRSVGVYDERRQLRLQDASDEPIVALGLGPQFATYTGSHGTGAAEDVSDTD